MHEWQYCTIDLNDLPRNTEVIDLLNHAGADGWELIGIASNQIAYLKRQITKPASVSVRASSQAKVAQT